MADEISTGGMTRAEINDFLAQPLLARLATADPRNMQPHVVPVWYGWDGQSLWISSYRSTRKISDLLKNPRCSVVIDEAIEGAGNKAVIFEGVVELLTEPKDFCREKITWVYARYLGDEGVLAAEPQEWIASEENTLIKLTPSRIMSWNG